MAVRNIFVVEPDLDRWQPPDPDRRQSEVPAFKKVIVGPRPLEGCTSVTLEPVWVALVIVLMALALVAGS